MLAVKIRYVSYDGRKRWFGITAKGKEWFLPYSKVELRQSAADPIVNIFIDRELAREGFAYALKPGREDSILSEQFLYYNRDPGYLRVMWICSCARSRPPKDMLHSPPNTPVKLDRV